MMLLVVGATGAWGAVSATHSPGTYTKATASGGYGLTLTSYNPGDGARNYEVYYLSQKSNKCYLAAGKSYNSDNTAYCLISNVAVNSTDGLDFTDSWGNIKNSSNWSGSGTSNTGEWNGSTHYAPITSSDVITLKISGYDQFSFLGRDNHATNSGKQFTVTIDGVAQTYTHSGTDNTIFRFDITTDEHTIVISGNGTDANRFRGFSLRLPSSFTVTYNANGGTGTIDNSTGTDITLSDGTDFTAPSNYTFAGWNTSNDGSGTSYAASASGINANLDLYATWTQDGTINANTGSANTTYTATLNATSIAIASAPTKDGNVLKGYYTETIGGTKVANADGTLVASTSYTDENGKWTNSGAAPTLYAQWEETVYYTVTLNPNGGTIDDATGWTLDNGQYKKTSVASGTELELPTFTKTDRILLTWRDASDNEYTSPVTVNSDLTITAIWGKEKETIIYSWESPEGTAIETGGTATHYNGSTAVDGNIRVNYYHADAGKYTISLNGKADYSTDHIRIALSENIKTGDEVQVTAYCYNSDSSKSAGPKMDTQDENAIFAQTSKIVNIYSSGSPTLYTYTVPSGINTNAVKLTRNLTGTATFITKLQIVRPSIAEEVTPTIPSSGWGSYCSPYALDFSVAATECEAYVVSAYDVNNLTITYAKQTGIVPAGTGILLKGDAGATSIVVSDEAGSAPAANELVGFTAATEYTKTGDTRYLGLSSGNWKEMNAGTIPANKAVLEITAAELTTLQGKLASGDAKFTIIYDDGETDNITEVRGTKYEVRDAYNLSGQRVGKDYKGIVIINGKKVVRK